MFIFEWPQLAWYGLVILGTGITIAKHGQPRVPHSIWPHLLSTVISVVILYYGGFFTEVRP